MLVPPWDPPIETMPVLIPRFPTGAHAPENPFARDIQGKRSWEDSATIRDDPELPRAVMFHDSFANQRVPFLSENFSEMIYLKGHFDADRVTTILDQGPVDVVIEETVERSIR